MPDKIRIYLKEDASTFYYLDASGDVQAIASPGDPSAYVVQDVPENWESIEIKWGRNSTYMGVFRSAASNVQFVGDGCKICQYVYHTFGFTGNLLFEVHELRGDWTGYDLLYSGRVDLADSSTVDEGYRFTAKIAEGGAYDVLKANDNTPQLIEIDPDTDIAVYLDGTELQSSISYIPLANIISPVFHQDRIAYPLTQTTVEGEYAIGKYRTVSPIGMPSVFAVDSEEYNNWMFKADRDMYIKLNFTQEIAYQLFTASNTTFSKLEGWLVVLREGQTTPYIDEKIWEDPTGPIGNLSGLTRVYLNDFTTKEFAIGANDQVYYEVRIFVSSVGTPATNNTTIVFFGAADIDNEQEINILSRYRLDPSFSYGIRIAELFSRLVTKMSGGAFSGIAPYLANPATIDYDSIPHQVVAMPSDSIRRLRTNTAGDLVNPSIQTTLQQYFNTVAGIYMAGMGINSSNQFFIAHLSELFNKSVETANVGEVIDFKISNASEYVFTQFKTGFAAQDYDKLNGRDEFNTTSTWKMSFNSLPFEERDFTSPYRADITGIENIRANLSKKKFIDARSDNDTFLIDIESTSSLRQTPGSAFMQQAFSPRRPNTSSNTNGVFSPDTIYNISLSPARSARRLGPWIKSINYRLLSSNILFQASEKNRYLSSDIGSGTITENLPIPVFDLPPILVIPKLLTFDTPSPVNLQALIASNPYGYVSGTTGGKPFRGFIIDVGRRPFRNDLRSWVLIATPDFDESLFK